MPVEPTNRIISANALNDLRGAFRDRQHAGRILGSLIAGSLSRDSIILAVDPGGVPVGQEISQICRLPLDILAVQPIRMGEHVVGAISFDGAVRLNNVLLDITKVRRHEVDDAVSAAMQTLADRIGELRGDLPFPDLRGKTGVVVDDGLSPEIVTKVAIAATRAASAARVVLALPAGKWRDIQRLAALVDLTCCASLHYGPSAGQDAYERSHALS